MHSGYWLLAMLFLPLLTAAVLVAVPDNRKDIVRYISVATGRDFADVTPTSGTYSGPAIGRLAYTKQAEIVELSEPAVHGVA